jgi:hypothetical protein
MVHIFLNRLFGFIVEITEGERLKEKTGNERKAQLWNACIETASETLRVGESFS